MRLEFGLPQCGAVADPEAVTAVAQRAEALGFDGFWVFDRILSPVEPRAPYSLPVKVRRTLDPLDTLIFAAAQTRSFGR